MSDYEAGWLVEIPGGHPAWWDGRAPNTFTTDPGDVFRMARQEDAVRALHWKLCIPPPGEVRITEHQWLTLPRPDPVPEGAAVPAAPLAGEAEEPKHCNDLCPPSYQGHWRDWHKGHGCDVEARTLIGMPKPEPAPCECDHSDPRFCCSDAAGDDVRCVCPPKPEPAPEPTLIEHEFKGINICNVPGCNEAPERHKAPSAAKETR